MATVLNAAPDLYSGEAFVPTEDGKQRVNLVWRGYVGNIPVYFPATVLLPPGETVLTRAAQIATALADTLTLMDYEVPA